MKQIFKYQHTKINQQAGFTIIELMIATLVFSVVLLLVTFGLIQVTRTYYKGVTGAKTQQAARAIMDEITRGIQFGGGLVTPTTVDPVAGTTYAICVSGSRFTYMLDRQVTVTDGSLGSDQTRHALVVDKPIWGCGKNPPIQTLNDPAVPLSSNSRELIPNHMRLAELEIRLDSLTDANTVLYHVQVIVVSGDTDILAGDHKQCAPFRAGTQFCAVSTLTTVVQKRLNTL